VNQQFDVKNFGRPRNGPMP